MVLSPGNEKADLERIQKMGAPWPAMWWNNRDKGRVLREVLLEVSWAAEPVLPDRREG
jgi:hypothetical protein